MNIAEPLRRVAILGDVHGDTPRLSIALEFIASVKGLDGILCVGDIVNLEADTESCCHLLIEHHVAVIRGNHDRWFLQNLGAYLAKDHGGTEIGLRSRAFIAGLPAMRDFETVSGPLLLCHGLLEDDLAGLYPRGHFCSPAVHLRLSMLEESHEVKWLVAGHTHRRMFQEFGGMRIVNPGTVCLEKDSGFCVVDFERGRIQFYDIDEKMNVAPSAELNTY